MIKAAHHQHKTTKQVSDQGQEKYRAVEMHVAADRQAWPLLLLVWFPGLARGATTLLPDATGAAAVSLRPAKCLASRTSRWSARASSKQCAVQGSMWSVREQQVNASHTNKVAQVT
jgi:hypothetical protein